MGINKLKEIRNLDDRLICKIFELDDLKLISIKKGKCFTQIYIDDNGNIEIKNK